MIIYFSLLSGLYFFLIITFIVSWKNIRYFIPDPSLIPDTKITVIIPVRNEETEILKLLNDLNNQTYPSSDFEVLIIDDASTDSTAIIVQTFKANFNLKLISLASDPLIKSHKKSAVETGITHAQGELIICTDGDCRVNKMWLSSIQNFFRKTQAQMIIGAVSFYEEKSIFEKMQTIEFSSLIGSGVASLNLGIPNMCNGANIAYQKSVFNEVNGYKGNEDVPSGDDEFLMHKIYKAYPDKVLFLKNKDTVVFTKAKENLKTFIQQRRRWASKWNKYEIKNIKYLAFFIFLYNLSIVLSLILAIFNFIPLSFFLISMSVKLSIDFLFLKQILGFFNKKTNILIFLLTGILYPFYVSFFAFISKQGNYEWKDRKVIIK